MVEARQLAESQSASWFHICKLESCFSFTKEGTVVGHSVLLLLLWQSMSILTFWAWSPPSKNKTGNIRELTHVLSSCGLVFIYDLSLNYTILSLAVSLLLAKNSFKFLSLFTLLFPRNILCFSYCELQNLLVSNTFIFFSTRIHIWKSIFSVSSHWNNTHTCNIIHSSKKHLKMIQDLSSGIYKKLPYPLEQLKLAYYTSSQVKHFLILPKLVVFLITQPLRTVNLEITAVEMICFPLLFWDSCNFRRACLQSNTNSSCLSFNLCFLWEFQIFLMPPLSCFRLVLIFKCIFVLKSSVLS